MIQKYKDKIVKRHSVFKFFISLVIALIIFCGKSEQNVKAANVNGELVYKSNGSYYRVNTLGNTKYVDVSRNADFYLKIDNIDNELFPGSIIEVYVEYGPGSYAANEFKCYDYYRGEDYYTWYVPISSALKYQQGSRKVYYQMTLANGQVIKTADKGSTNAFYVHLLGEYTVSYNANGGVEAPSSQTKYQESALTLSRIEPIRTGYTFKGWSTSSTATSATYQPGDRYTSNSNVTLYAVWEIDKYTVSYNANGGTGAPSSQTKTYGNTLYLSSTKPTRTGYTFKGWSTNSTATSATYQAGGSYTSNSSTTLYAVWEIDKYTISYNANGGTGAPSSQMKTYGNTLYLSNIKPTRTGYTFKGWSTNSTATSATYQAGGSYTSNSSTTLYAVWEINKYTVSYNANGGTGAPSSQTKTYGNSLYLSNTKPIRTGYTFKGWSTNSTATSVTYQAGGNYTSNSNTTLYAVWEINKYIISYNANGGMGAPSSQTKTYGDTLYLSNTKPTRTGYTFKGWSTSSTASSATYQSGDNYASNNDITLYAVWQKKIDENSNSSGIGGNNGINNGNTNGENTNTNSSNQNANTINKQTVTAKSKTVSKGAKAFNINAVTNGDGNLTYSSSNKKVVIVNSAGMVRVKGYGKATVTIKASATSRYTGAVKKITITVIPKKVTIKKASSTGRKRLSVLWKKDKRVTGYQVQFSTRKDFKRDTYERAFKKSSTKMNIVGLKSGKTYYVRIRSYVKVGKKKYYGVWSKVKSVKIQ